eukprot:TRINITY_DN3693_c0_g5_i1.p2 TRINITY_DN3693_c0_g5~~TRINITY_DN3693_c0_g5_i1.p2  ORF type:complete len:148 (+),score=18.22 TRINITY_DN3693_c0_g5_i1:24-446(+)
MNSNERKTKGEMVSKLSYIGYQFALISKSGESIREKFGSVAEGKRQTLEARDRRGERSVGTMVRSSKKIDMSRVQSDYSTEDCKRLPTASAHKKNNNSDIRRFCSSTMGHSRNSYRNTQKIYIRRPRGTLSSKGDESKCV